MCICRRNPGSIEITSLPIDSKRDSRSRDMLRISFWAKLGLSARVLKLSREGVGRPLWTALGCIEGCFSDPQSDIGF